MPNLEGDDVILTTDAGAVRTIKINDATGTNPGDSLLIQAGQSSSGGNDRAGGDLILNAGLSRGLASSKIDLKAATPQGPITVDSTPTFGGRDYKINDSLAVAGGAGGTVNVDTVKNGMVTELGLHNGGVGYQTGDGVATAQGTAGTGCTVAIQTVSSAIGTINSTPTNGGSGYTVGDILTISAGGTGATVVVTSVSNGVVTGVSLYEGGSGYTTGSGKSTTGGTGTGCTIEILTLVRTITSINATPTNGGSGYVANDILTVAGGNGGQVRVSAVSGGAVTALSLHSGGSGYTAGAGHATNSGIIVTAGSGCTIQISSVSVGTGVITSINSVPTNGGSGYTVGDILTVAGGSGGQVKVSAVAGGVVTTISLYTAGSGYSTGTGIATSPRTPGTGCTINILAVSSGAITSIYAIPTNGGSGYAVNDYLTVVQTNGVGGQVKVVAVANGIVTAITGTGGGGSGYQKTDFGIATTGGTGKGCTVKITSITGSQSNTPDTKVTVLGTGSVGIATTTPEEKLEINGNVKITGSPLGFGFDLGPIRAVFVGNAYKLDDMINIKKLGFNTIIHYLAFSPWDNEYDVETKVDKLLVNAEMAGLRVIPRLYAGTDAVPQSVIDWVDENDSRDVLYGYYLYDEPAMNSVTKEMQEARIDAFRDVTAKPLCIADNGDFGYEGRKANLSSEWDIIFLDIYYAVQSVPYPYGDTPDMSNKGNSLICYSQIKYACPNAQIIPAVGLFTQSRTPFSDKDKMIAFAKDFARTSQKGDVAIFTYDAVERYPDYFDTDIKSNQEMQEAAKDIFKRANNSKSRIMINDYLFLATDSLGGALELFDPRHSSPNIYPCNNNSWQGIGAIAEGGDFAIKHPSKGCVVLYLYFKNRVDTTATKVVLYETTDNHVTRTTLKTYDDIPYGGEALNTTQTIAPGKALGIKITPDSYYNQEAGKFISGAIIFTNWDTECF